MFESFLSKTKEHWPIVTVVVTGVLYLFGYVRQFGYWLTLGVTALNSPPSRENLVIEGLLAVISFISAPITLAALVFLLSSLYHFALWTKLRQRITPSLFRLAAGADAIRRSEKHSGAVVGVLFLMGSAINGVLLAMVGWAIGLPLRTGPKINTLAFYVLTDVRSPYPTTVADGVLMLVSVFVTGFILVAMWVAIGMPTSLKKRLVCLWLSLITFGYLVNYIILDGAARTVRPLPIVTFSDQDKLIGEHTICLLMGVDDKQFAMFFVTLPEGVKANRKPVKGIMYIPRDQVHWMAAVSQQPLYVFAHYYDYFPMQRNQNVPGRP